MNKASNSNSSSAISPRTAEHYWQAALARDRRADGTFFLAVRSTHIYCRPSCPARRPLRRNVVFFQTPADAEQHGFRACLRCRPKDRDEAIAIVRQAAKLLGNSGDSFRWETVAGNMNVAPAKLRRAFRYTTGLTPRDFAEAFRIARFRKLLRAGAEITDALYECGYGSPSRIYEKTNQHLGMTPASYQKGAPGMQIAYSIAKTTLGNVLVAATARGVSAVYLGENEKNLVAELRREYPRANIAESAAANQRWIQEIVNRVEGTAPSLDLPLDVHATAFQRRVWQELQKIPRGTTQTYTQIARQLGSPKSVRAVARACATNPVSIIVPCHRVVRADGHLAGYRWGLQRKEKLLEREGARLDLN